MTCGIIDVALLSVKVLTCLDGLVYADSDKRIPSTPNKLSGCLHKEVTTHANLHRSQSGAGWHVLFLLHLGKG